MQDLPGGGGRRPGGSSGSARASARSARCTSETPRRRRWSYCSETNYAGFNNYFGGFGFWEAFRTAEDADKYPLEPYTALPPSEWTVDRMRKVKYGLAGTVDQVKGEIASLKTIGGNGDLEWFGWFFDQGFMPWDEEMRQIELFAEHIIPAFR